MKNIDVFVIVWIALTIVFLVLEIVYSIKGDASTALTFCAMFIACGARVETQILKNRIAKMEDI